MVSLGNSIDQDINYLVSLGFIYTRGLKHLLCIICSQNPQEQQETHIWQTITMGSHICNGTTYFAQWDFHNRCPTHIMTSPWFIWHIFSSSGHVLDSRNHTLKLINILNNCTSSFQNLVCTITILGSSASYNGNLLLCQVIRH